MKVKKIMIENSLFASFVEMILLWYSILIIKVTQIADKNSGIWTGKYLERM